MSVRFIFLALLLAWQLSYAADAPPLQLPSGRVVPVLGITRSTLHISNESVLVLKYQTQISFEDIPSLYGEVETVWEVFQKKADEAGVSAAIVSASEKPALLGISKAASWVWKKGADGKWHAPKPGDRALVPKEQ